MSRPSIDEDNDVYRFWFTVFGVMAAGVLLFLKLIGKLE